MPKTVITPPGTQVPIAPFSPGTLADGVVYVSGTLAFDKDNNVWVGGNNDGLTDVERAGCPQQRQALHQHRPEGRGNLAQNGGALVGALLKLGLLDEAPALVDPGRVRH